MHCHVDWLKLVSTPRDWENGSNLRTATVAIEKVASLFRTIKLLRYIALRPFLLSRGMLRSDRKHCVGG